MKRYNFREVFNLKRLKIGVGAIFMLAAMILSDRGELLCLYFLSAILHELGHLVAAWRLRLGIREVRLDFSGIRISINEELSSYKSEMVLALAGPLVNLASVVICLVFLRSRGISAEALEGCIEGFFKEGSITLNGAIGFFGICSLLQGTVNLLPVKTFDGGRVLYCSISSICSERVAERALDISSSFSAFVLWTVALYLMLKISSGLGIFVFAICIFCSTLKDTDVCK